MNTDPKKIRVVFISNYIGPNGGGHSVNSYILAEALQKNDIDITLLTLNSKTNNLSNLKVNYLHGNNAFFSLNPSLIEALLFSFFSFIWLKFNESNFDLVHANGSAGLFYSLFRKKPLITHIRATRTNYDFSLHTYPRETRTITNYLSSINAFFTYRLEMLSARLSDLVFCNSKQCAKALTLESKTHKNKIIPIPNGVDCNLFKFTEVALQQKIITVARLSYGKYIERVIMLFSRLLMKVPSAKLCIIGTGEAEVTLKEYVRSLSLDDSISFTGKVRHGDLPKYLVNQNIFIYGSMPGSTLNEALCCGIPFVVYVGREKFTTGSLIDEAAKHGCGFITFSESDFVDKLYLMISNHAIYYEMRNKCHIFSLTYLDINEIAKLVLSVYRSLITN